MGGVCFGVGCVCALGGGSITRWLITAGGDGTCATHAEPSMTTQQTGIPGVNEHKRHTATPCVPQCNANEMLYEKCELEPGKWGNHGMACNPCMHVYAVQLCLRTVMWSWCEWVASWLRCVDASRMHPDGAMPNLKSALKTHDRRQANTV